jgi:hypothetical protein
VFRGATDALHGAIVVAIPSAGGSCEERHHFHIFIPFSFFPGHKPIKDADYL